MSNYKTKVCQICGKEYQPTNGRQRYCAECRSAGEKVCDAKWEKAHRENCRVRGAKYYKAHPEKVKVRAAKYRKANLEKERARALKWNGENPEKCKANGAKWKKVNPEKQAVTASKRRAAKYANTPIDEMLTSTEWLAILVEHDGHCHYCGKEARLTLDHVIPLSKGGKHNANNVVPACAHCNGSKGNKTLEEWWAKKQREAVSV